MVEAEKAVLGLMAGLGITTPHLWNISLLRVGADNNSVMKFTTFHKETRASIFTMKRTLKGMGYVLNDDLTTDVKENTPYFGVARGEGGRKRGD